MADFADLYRTLSKRVSFTTEVHQFHGILWSSVELWSVGWKFVPKRFPHEPYRHSKQLLCYLVHELVSIDLKKPRW